MVRIAPIAAAAAAAAGGALGAVTFAGVTRRIEVYRQLADQVELAHAEIVIELYRCYETVMELLLAR